MIGNAKHKGYDVDINTDQVTGQVSSCTFPGHVNTPFRNSLPRMYAELPATFKLRL